MSAVLGLETVKAVVTATRNGVWMRPSRLVRMWQGRPDLVVRLVSKANGVVLNLCDVTAHIDAPGQIGGLPLPRIDGATEPSTAIVQASAQPIPWGVFVLDGPLGAPHGSMRGKASQKAQCILPRC
jgi:hypothetical protein